MEISERIDAIDARLIEIRSAAETAKSEELDTLTVETDALKEERSIVVADIEKRKTLLNNVATGKIESRTIETPPEERGKKMENKMLTPDMPEYRSAYFKTLAGEKLDEIEQRAFTATTANFGGAMPVTTLNEIWSNIEEEHSILGDITLYRTGTVMEVSVHTAIVAGDAAVVAQGVANDDEENTFIKVTLSGKDFSKSVEISYALGFMTAPALESYLVREISDRLGAALARDVVAQIIADTAAGNKKTSAAVKITTFVELNSLFALLKQAKNRVVYANSTTIYTYLTSLVDSTGRPLFQASMQDGNIGNLIGAPVKIEDAIADNVFFIGDPKKVKGNMIQDIMIESDKDIKRHVNIYAGYARFECKLSNPLSFVIFTMKLV